MKSRRENTVYRFVKETNKLVDETVIKTNNLAINKENAI